MSCSEIIFMGRNNKNPTGIFCSLLISDFMKNIGQMERRLEGGEGKKRKRGKIKKIINSKTSL